MLETSPITNINNSTGVSTATALTPVASSEPASVASSKKLKPLTGTSSSVKETKSGSFFSRLFLRLCGAPNALKEEENTTPNPSDNSSKITAKEMETTEPQLNLKDQREGPTEMQKTSISSLLPPLDPRDIGKKCLVLDLDETLVHSSFQPVQPVDYVIPVEIDGQMQNVYVLKRPGVDEFLAQVGKWYEVVVFTASLSKYADPVMDLLDVDRVVRHRLFREACSNHGGSFVKVINLSKERYHY
ncbi:hypothetical protein K7432_010756 [Basidiobolus ranarum]|uniref:Mitochondrial import inner membrane translocase subunit TIM50 n=1 Tax=Basidiobolus ranarum TaxID=34480 RepID=A0ABR2WNA8_9FUNG